MEPRPIFGNFAAPAANLRGLLSYVTIENLRPAVIQRKVTNGYRAMWAAKGEADVRTVVATAALRTKATPFTTLLATITA